MIAKKTSLRSLGLVFLDCEDLHLPCLDVLPTSLVDLEIGPFETEAGWDRLRECVRDRLPSLRFLHVVCARESDDDSDSEDSEESDDTIFSKYDRARLGEIMRDRPDVSVTLYHCFDGNREEADPAWRGATRES